MQSARLYAGRIRWLYIFVFSSVNNPHTRPFKHELSVNPGKYGPIGNISVPSTSATPATTAACAGPIRIAAVTGAINAKPIFTFHA